MANAARNIVDAEVVSAIKLDKSYKEELVKILNRLAGRDVKPKYKVDPSLLGGMVIRIGDKVIDGSVKNKLKTLRQHLVSKIS
jgi:F-type H+-transporting ATPase subunit delta